MASTLLQSISQDDYERARFLSKRKFENDLESDKNTAIKIAMYEMAAELLKNGVSVEIITKSAKLPIEEIEKLKKLI